MFEKTVDLDLNFGEVSLGWKLAQQLLKHAYDVIESNFGYFFFSLCLKTINEREKRRNIKQFDEIKNSTNKGKIMVLQVKKGSISWQKFV